MLARLFVLFTVVPLVELYFLIKVGSYIGALNTILLLLATGFAGALLVRFQGLRTMRQIFHNLSQGSVPAEELLDGLFIFAAGVLLLTPGMITDIMALFLLVPFTRTLFKRWLRRRFDRMVASGKAQLYFRSGSWGNL